MAKSITFLSGLILAAGLMMAAPLAAHADHHNSSARSAQSAAVAKQLNKVDKRIDNLLSIRSPIERKRQIGKLRSSLSKLERKSSAQRGRRARVNDEHIDYLQVRLADINRTTEREFSPARITDRLERIEDRIYDLRDIRDPVKKRKRIDSLRGSLSRWNKVSKAQNGRTARYNRTYIGTLRDRLKRADRRNDRRLQALRDGQYIERRNRNADANGTRRNGYQGSER
jgi:hypothetical protein